MRKSVADLVLALADSCDFASRRAATADPAQRLRGSLMWFATWPPDLFGVTWAVLQRTGAYRYLASLPPSENWPPVPDWDEFLRNTAQEWYVALNDASVPSHVPPGIQNAIDDIVTHAAQVELETLQHRRLAPAPSAEWQLVRALLILHAWADQTCAAFGLTSIESPGGHDTLPRRARARIRLLASLLLTTNGTVSRIPKHVLTVLPKLRTPQRGLSIRSLSHHLCVYAGEVNVVWRCVPFLGIREHSINALLAPHPRRFSTEWIQPLRSPSYTQRTSQEGHFEFRCSDRLNVDELMGAIGRAEVDVGPLDLIVLPELAITEDELDAVRRAMLQGRFRGRSRVPAILAGLRRTEHRDDGSGDPPVNELVFSFFFAGKWYESRQQKHHRWCLDESQIRQYQLSGRLTTRWLWWEGIELHRRNQSFLLAAPWLCIAPLICEDLAQQDPLADLVRSVGPQLVNGLLMDGPQLAQRWPGRYASVLADDPGSAVLTFTSAGIAATARREDSEVVDRTISVALWKDAARGWRRIEVRRDATTNEPAAEYPVLTISADFREEFTADGRSDGGVTPRLMLDQCPTVVMNPADFPLSQPTPATLASSTATRSSARQDLEELTRLVFAFDHILLFPDDAAVVTQLANGTVDGAEALEMATWFPRLAVETNEVATLARSKFREVRHAQADEPPPARGLRDVLELGSALLHTNGAEPTPSSPVARWREILRAIRAQLKQEEARFATRGDTPPSPEACETLRASWLVAAVLHFLVRARFDVPGVAYDAMDVKRLLNEIGAVLEDGCLMEPFAWSAIVNNSMTQLPTSRRSDDCEEAPRPQSVG